MRARIGIVGCVVAVTASCALPARTATLEREQRRLHDEVTTLETRVRELETRLATVAKRVGASPTGRKVEREREPAPAPSETRMPDGTTAPRAATPTPIPPVLPDLDLDGLRRESSRQLPPVYRRGVELIRSGDYEEAIRVLREFVRGEHASRYVAGAHYWIGQAHMQLGEFYQAILAFTEVQQRAPRTALASAAGLASGVAFLELGNVTEARRAFERVVAEHPNAPEAAKASARLRLLDSRTP